MTRAAAISALALWGLGGAARTAHARIGLSTQFVDVAVEGLEPGGVYSVRELRGSPYSVKNRGDGAVDVAVEVQVPKRTVPPYEAVPDPAWLALSAPRQRIEPGALGSSDIVIRIPDDPSLAGRHFEAALWARTLDTGIVGAGLFSRLRFSIGPGPGAGPRREPEAAAVSLNFELSPSALTLSRATTGGLYDGTLAEGRRFTLRNRADAAVRLVLKAVPWPVDSLPLPPGGWEATADVSWVRFEPAVVVVDGGSAQEVRVLLDDAPRSLRGAKSAFFIQVQLPDGRIVGRTHRGFVAFPVQDAPASPRAPWKH